MVGEQKTPKSLPKFYCLSCDYKTMSSKDFNRHLLTLKHKNGVNGELMENEKKEKNNNYYNCFICNFTTSKQSEFNRHILTLKHKKRGENAEIVYDKECVKCEYCSKSYSKQSNLWKHKQKCTLIIPNKNDVEKTPDNDNKAITDVLVLELVKNSKEMQKILIEQNKELQNTLIEQNNKLIELSQKSSIINTNSHNTTNQNFNLNLFLNETCKDAINIMDFVNSMKLNIEDFEATGRLGYVEGISRIIVNSMKDMDIDKRPMHCTDCKRETLYIKDQDVWMKDNNDKTKFKRAVKQVAQLNLNQLPKWQEKYPESTNINTPENEEFIKLSLAALGSRTPEEEEIFVGKIMKNVLKEIVIDKKTI